jgi:hypothetical protein
VLRSDEALPDAAAEVAAPCSAPVAAQAEPALPAAGAQGDSVLALNAVPFAAAGCVPEAPAGAQAEADGLPASPAVAAQDAARERRVVPSLDAERYAPEALVADLDDCLPQCSDAEPGSHSHQEPSAAHCLEDAEHWCSAAVVVRSEAFAPADYSVVVARSQEHVLAGCPEPV